MQKQTTPRTHAEVIKAWADGAEIEVWSQCNEGWLLDIKPTWNTHYEYRVKPEPKKDTLITGVVSQLTDNYFDANENKVGFIMFQDVSYAFEHDNLKLTFDGETGKLKSAEVINK